MKRIALVALSLIVSLIPTVAIAHNIGVLHKHESMHPFFSALFAVLAVGIFGVMFLVISKHKNGNQGK
jgi:hypothetical protein